MIERWFPVKHLNQYRYEGPELTTFGDFYRDFRFRELTLEDFYKNAVFEVANRRDRYLNYLKNGHRCFGFEDQKGIIVTYFWLTIGEPNRFRPVPVFRGSNWLLDSHEAYIWDCHTILGYRRRGLYKEGLKRLVAMCQRQKIKQIMMSSEVSNRVSNAGIVLAGFKLYGTVYFRALGWLKMIKCCNKKLKILSLSSPVTTTDVFPEL